MGKITFPEKVRLISAICYRDTELKDVIVQKLEATFGPINNISTTIDFSLTNYYEDEMGNDLLKSYVSFKELIDPITLPDIKIFTNEIEDEYSQNGNRTINIDPGYIELAKLILATTKNFSHRIYIGKGIYGDVQLYWKGGCFNTNPWTYPDYKINEIKSFFEKIRKEYFEQIKGS